MVEDKNAKYTLLDDYPLIPNTYPPFLTVQDMSSNWTSASRPSSPSARYVTSRKTHVAKNLAYSVFFNRRNTENALHGLYSQILTELTAKDNNITPYVQYNLWLPRLNDGAIVPDDYKLKGRGHHSLADDEEEIEVESQASDESDDQLDVIDRSSTPTGEGDNLEKHDEHEDDVHSTEDLEDEEEEDDFDEAGNISFATDHTQPGSDVDKIPDLALVHTRLLWKALCLAEPRNHPALKARNHKLTVHWQHRNGIHIIHGCVPFLGELKSGAPRDLDLKYNNKEAKAKFDEHMTGKFFDAHTDLAEYLVHCFARHPYIEEVVAFVAVGVYWHYAIFEQSDLPDYDWDEMQIKSHGSSKAKHRAFYKKFPKAYYEVGTKESDAAFEEMYQKNIHPLGSDGDLSAEQWSEVEKQD